MKKKVYLFEKHCKKTESPEQIELVISLSIFILNIIQPHMILWELSILPYPRKQRKKRKMNISTTFARFFLSIRAEKN